LILGTERQLEVRQLKSMRNFGERRKKFYCEFLSPYSLLRTSIFNNKKFLLLKSFIVYRIYEAGSVSDFRAVSGTKGGIGEGI